MGKPGETVGLVERMQIDAACLERRASPVMQAIAKDIHEAAAALTSLIAERDGLREALEPFAGDKLPGNNRDIIEYNRHGLRCLMSPMQIARRDAFFALYPEEHPLAKQAARAALSLDTNKGDGV